MFETHESGRRKSFFSIPGEHHWDHVGVAVCMPWFYVTFSLKSDEGFALSQNFMLSDVKQLTELAHRENVEIRFVDLVSPEYMNHAGRWKMEPLKEVWLRVPKDYQDQYEYVYVLENGGSYRDTAAPPADNTSIDIPIFKI
jgi:hypothetical protein